MNTFRLLLLTLWLGLAPTLALAQYYDDEYVYDEYAFEYEPYSGDPEFDLAVAALNALVGGDADGFAEDLAYRYGAPRQEVRTLIVERHYPPDYLWTVAATAKAAERPWNEVFPLFEQQRTQGAGAAGAQGRGWGVTARRLGIQPGSAAFHALKSDLRAQPAHWKHKPRTSGATMAPQPAPAIEAAPGRGPGKGAGKPAKGNGQGKAKGKGKGKGK
jgi:hypothetical protein